MNAKRLHIPLFLVWTALFSNLQAKDVTTSFDESLALRRISEYWKEKDYSSAIVRIDEFLKRNPNSAYAEQLFAMLGDLHFLEKDYAKALSAYDKIQEKEFLLKTQYHRLLSLYEVGDFEEFILSADLFLNYPQAKENEIHAIRFELAESYLALAYAPGNEKKKKELLKNALAHYELLAKTKFFAMSLNTQAQIYSDLEEYPKAASLYLLVAEQAQKKEDWLFRAAHMQLQFDPSAAINTFKKIVELEGEHAPKAAFNHLSLLFQERRYKDYILAYDHSIKHIPMEKLPLIQYFLGKSLVHNREFAKAVVHLSESLNSKTLDVEQEKSALLTLASCAKEMQDIALFEKTLDQLKSEFGSDSETHNCMLVHAQLCQGAKDWAKSRGSIEELLKLAPDHPKKEALIFDCAMLLSKEEKWEESALAFEAFIAKFPESSQRSSAMRHAINFRLKDFKHAGNETKIASQKLLLNSLQAALCEDKTFTSTERKKMRALVGKTQYELGQYEAAIDTLSEYITDFRGDSTCQEAYLLLAYCHMIDSEDQIHFVLNAEKALALNPKIESAIELRLKLFNTYLGLAEQAAHHEKPELMAQAANHLFLALDKPVSKENERWLAGYYYEQYQNGQQDAAARAAHVLEKLLDIKKDSIALSIDDKSLEKEAEAIRLASLYEKTGALKERAELLSSLTDAQKSQPDLPWKYKRMAEFELGRTWGLLGDKDKAIATFSGLISSSSHTSSWFAIAAQLEKSKLEFSMLQNIKDKDATLAINAICDELIDVQSKRKLHSEPLHLEAALCYVDIKSELVEEAQKLNRRHFLLRQMRENFSNEEDPLVQDYLSAADQFPDKEFLYNLYLDYVDAMILQLEGEKNQDPVKLQKAKQDFELLLREATDDTLRSRIRKSMGALPNNL